ncbi:somatostatin-like receptor F_48D10.1 isoform X2 [Siniperca chuatsi]|uniref:somatostatin-like receptor F_48D10.1 isoform X2 n=1 Tax=Siniperca chuatsi TaxID=119488 RepID=UPI001CE16C61|nr:somatostatin-like receptor F_48D10.1 isoform X2 [Siniperca chuatsi]
MENFKGNGTINQNNTRLGDVVWYFLPTVVTVPPLALPANALVIYLLLGKPGICSTSEIFTLNLALFDMLFCFIVLIEYIRFLCNQTMEAANFLAWGLNQAGGPMLLCILGLDSYVAVCHPLVFLRLKDPKLRLLLCLVGPAGRRSIQ